MTTFEELGLQQELLDAIKILGFEQPTQIQKEAMQHRLLPRYDLTDMRLT